MKQVLRNKFILFIFIIVLIFGFLYLSGIDTFTSYESLISGNSSFKTSGIKVKLNDIDIINDTTILDNNFFMNNVVWNSTHTREGKISPGSSGSFNLKLDPEGSEVAILYEFRFVDKKIDANKLLTFENITNDDSNVVRTAIDTYSGIVSLNDIKNGKIINFNIDFLFDSLEDIEGIENDEHTYDDLFEINFTAVQYNGEELVPYVE